MVSSHPIMAGTLTAIVHISPYKVFLMIYRGRVTNTMETARTTTVVLSSWLYLRRDFRNAQSASIIK